MSLVSTTFIITNTGFNLSPTKRFFPLSTSIRTSRPNIVIMRQKCLKRTLVVTINSTMGSPINERLPPPRHSKSRAEQMSTTNRITTSTRRFNPSFNARETVSPSVTHTTKNVHEHHTDQPVAHDQTV